MEIKINSASAHVSNVKNGLYFEADANINGTQVSEIVNGHVTRPDSEMEGHRIPVADFHDAYGTRNVTFYGEPDIEAQVALLNNIAVFCTEVRGVEYELMSE